MTLPGIVNSSVNNLRGSGRSSALLIAGATTVCGQGHSSHQLEMCGQGGSLGPSYFILEGVVTHGLGSWPVTLTDHLICRSGCRLGSCQPRNFGTGLRLAATSLFKSRGFSYIAAGSERSRMRAEEIGGVACIG